MPSFKLTRLAKEDLKAIARYTVREWGTAQRNHYLLQLDHCFHQISENPSLGVACDNIRSGYRKQPQGSHIIFYRTTPKEQIEIIRVLHKNMDVPSKFPEA